MNIFKCTDCGKQAPCVLLSVGESLIPCACPFNATNPAGLTCNFKKQKGVSEG